MKSWRILNGAAALLILAVTATDAQQVVISQVYGGGGNTGATYTHDFVELFNAGQTSATLNGWSLQYTNATGVSWTARALPNISIPAGGYYLIQQSSDGAAGSPLPTPDHIPQLTSNMNATTGKIALVKTTTALSGSTVLPNANIADLVGYGGTASEYEGRTSGGTRAPAPSNANSISRLNGGCQDTNNNGADFSAAVAAARNSATPVSVCPLVTNPTGTGEAAPNPLFAGDSVTLTVLVTPGGGPTSTGITVTGNTTSIGGVASDAFTDNGGNSFSLTKVVPCAQALGTVNIPITVADAQLRSSTFDIVFEVVDGTLVLGDANAFPPDDGHPANATRCAGETASFSVRALGGGLTYQWFNGANVALTNTGNISGATSPRLFIANVGPADAAAGPYKCTVTRACSATSVTTNAATLTIGAVANATDKQVVISQVYGGGGNSGGLFSNDFVELFNKGATAVNLTGWSVQYASTGAATAANFDRPPRVTVLSGTLQPGQYLLIKQQAGNTPSTALPTADVDGTAQANGGINISATGGKLALVKHSDPLAEMCPYGNGANPTACSVVDFVGWNAASACAEGANPAAATANATAVMRLSECIDTDNNGNDFVVSAPNPHNSVSPIAPSVLEPPADIIACAGQTATFDVTAAGPCLVYQWQVNQAPALAGFVNVSTGTGGNTAVYTTGVLSAADDGNQYRVLVSNSYGPMATSAAATLNIGLTTHELQIVISELYPGGGNMGATYQNDYVELYNKGTTVVSLAGWSIQYASATGTSWGQKVNLSGQLAPGHFFLIQLPGGTGCSGSPCGVGLPPANIVDTSFSGMGAGGGKLALVRSTDVLESVICPADCRIVDLVGYGNANCFEGAAAAPAPANNTQAVTRTPRCSDTNQNGVDFALAPAAPHADTTFNGIATDLNGDGVVDGNVAGAGNDDLDIFMACMTRDRLAYDPLNLPAGCNFTPDCSGRIQPDFDKDGDVDPDDFAVYQRCYSGAALQNDPNCGD